MKSKWVEKSVNGLINVALLAFIIAMLFLLAQLSFSILGGHQAKKDNNARWDSMRKSASTPAQKDIFAYLEKEIRSKSEECPSYNHDTSSVFSYSAAYEQKKRNILAKEASCASVVRGNMRVNGSLPDDVSYTNEVLSKITAQRSAE